MIFIKESTTKCFSCFFFVIMNTEILKNYETLSQHNPVIVNLIKKCLAEQIAYLQKGRGTLNGGTRLVFHTSSTQLDRITEIKLVLKSHGYCNDIALRVKKRKNRVAQYVEFSTYKFKSFDELWAYMDELKDNFSLKQIESWNKHPQKFCSIIIGGLLGDCYANRCGTDTFFSYTYTAKKKEYPLWLHQYFSELGYCNKKIPTIKVKFDKRTSKEYYSIQFHTFSSKSFNEIHNLFYKKQNDRFVKIIPKNIEEYLTPLAMAVCFMDDGSGQKNSGSIATNGFSKECIERFRDAVKNKFDISMNLQIANRKKEQWRLYIPTTEFEKFKALVQPHILPCFYYKLGL